MNAEKLIARAQKRLLRRILVDANGCFLYQGATNTWGYGSRKFLGKKWSTHRLSYYLFRDQNFPKHLCVCHKCDVPLCCNPAHLFLGTNKDNSADCVAKGRISRLPGSANPSSKVSETDVAKMRSMRNCGVFLKDIAAEFGIGTSQVWRIVTNKSWQCAAIIVVLLSLSASSFAGPFVSEEKEKLLRNFIPDETYANDPRLILYTEREMPRAYQFAGPGDRVAGFHDAYHNISGDPEEAAKGHGFGGSGNVEFPWRRPGGTDRTKGVDSFKFILLPIGKPIVWFTADRGPDCDNNLGITRLYQWRFPIGTKIGEVLTWKIGQYDYPFEMRIRERLADQWAVDILRPYPTAESLVSAVSGLSDFTGKAGLLSHLASAKPLPVRTLADTSHRTQRAINVKAAVDELPDLPDSVTIKLLSVRPWKSALGETWRDRCFAPSGGITPVGYEATFLGSDQTSCKRCHESAGQHVDTFDAPRNWYGFVRGSDQILSFHPVEPSCISDNGAYRPARIRNIPGVIERYEPSKHLKEHYQELKP